MDRYIEMDAILAEWQLIKAQLEKLFQERNQTNIKCLMEKGIELFKQYVLSTNIIAMQASHTINDQQLKYKPVNFEERLEFIITKPQLYHSFRQLSELIVEQEKLFAKITIKKSSRPNA